VSNLRMQAPSVKVGGTVEVTAEVANTGSRAASPVVQLYIHQKAGSASRPVRELKGFKKVTLAAGEKKTVRFTLGKNELSFWSSQTRGWVQDAADFDVWVGFDSAATLQAGFRVVP
jgi:beta-glucosidase